MSVLRFLRCLAATFVALAMMGCGIPTSPGAFKATPEAKLLDDIVNKLHSGDFDGVESNLDASIAGPSAHDRLVKMATALPASESVTSVTPVSWNFVSISGRRKATVSAEYEFPTRHIIATATLADDPGHFKILALHFTPTWAPLAEINALTFKGKGAIHYVFLAATLMAIGISVFALVHCARQKDFKQKGLWIAFILIGIFGFSLNWTTGAFELKPLTFDIMSAGLIRNGWVGPWILTFCIPVGAIAYLLKHRMPPASA